MTCIVLKTTEKQDLGLKLLFAQQGKFDLGYVYKVLIPSTYFECATNTRVTPSGPVTVYQQQQVTLTTVVL